MKTNYIITDMMVDRLLNSGYNVITDSSRASDYVCIQGQKGFEFVIRISNHDACTARSRCADLEYNLCDLIDEDYVRIGYDEDGDLQWCDDDYAVQIEDGDERRAYIVDCIMEDLNKDWGWIRFKKYML